MRRRNRSGRGAGPWLTSIIAVLIVASLGAMVWQAGLERRAAPIETPQRITAAKARELTQDGQAVLYDVRSAAAYQAKHAAGAVHVPEEQLTEWVTDLPRDKLLIFY